MCGWGAQLMISMLGIFGLSLGFESQAAAAATK